VQQAKSTLQAALLKRQASWDEEYSVGRGSLMMDNNDSFLMENSIDSLGSIEAAAPMHEQSRDTNYN